MDDLVARLAGLGAVSSDVSPPLDMRFQGGGGWMPSIAKPSISPGNEYPYVKPDPVVRWALGYRLSSRCSLG